MPVDSEKVVVVGIPVSKSDFPLSMLDRALAEDRSLIVASVNPLGCAIAGGSPQYVEHLKRFDWVICDGIGMVIAARCLGGISIKRTTFDRTSLAGPVLQWATRNDIKLVVVGAQPGVAERAGGRMAELTPGLQFEAGFSGYGDAPAAAKAYLLEHPGRLVVCGLGAPRQEAFLIRLKDAGWIGIGFTCGGFLDQLVESVDYFPRWIDRLHLRFLYRLYKEPRRLWKRYLIDYQVFVWRFVRDFTARRILGR